MANTAFGMLFGAAPTVTRDLFERVEESG